MSAISSTLPRMTGCSWMPAMRRRTSAPTGSPSSIVAGKHQDSLGDALAHEIESLDEFTHPLITNQPAHEADHWRLSSPKPRAHRARRRRER